MSTNVKIVAVLVAREGRASDLAAFLSEMVAPCRAEPGNLRWDIWQDQADPSRFVLDELYVDDDAVADHRASEHVQIYLNKINDLAKRTSFVLRSIDTF